MKLLHLLLFIATFKWVLCAKCFLSENEKTEIQKYVVPQPALTGVVIVLCNIIITVLFTLAGYLIAGYHFYEQVLHDIEDEIDLRERDDRIKRQMAEQDLLWQMHRAKQDRRAKQLEKLKEKEAEVKKAWKNDKDKLSEQIKASASRIAELEEELKHAEKAEEKRKVNKIKVHKHTKKLEQGQKLLSGCENPITPPPGPAPQPTPPPPPPSQQQPQADAQLSKENEQELKTYTTTVKIPGDCGLIGREKVQEPLTPLTGDTVKRGKGTGQKKSLKDHESAARMVSDSRKASLKSSRKSLRSSKRSQKSSKKCITSEDGSSKDSKASSKASSKRSEKSIIANSSKNIRSSKA